MATRKQIRRMRLGKEWQAKVMAYKLGQGGKSRRWRELRDFVTQSLAEGQNAPAGPVAP
jgi:hypothetical protein